MPKNRPAIGDQNWGNVLNSHLNQLSPNGGGLNSGDTASRPTLTAGDDGYTYLDTTTKELLKWNGTGWDVLLAQGITGLTVTETDGTPVINDVKTMSFPNNSLTTLSNGGVAIGRSFGGAGGTGGGYPVVLSGYVSDSKFNGNVYYPSNHLILSGRIPDYIPNGSYYVYGEQIRIVNLNSGQVTKIAFYNNYFELNDDNRTNIAINGNPSIGFAPGLFLRPNDLNLDISVFSRGVPGNVLESDVFYFYPIPNNNGATKQTVQLPINFVSSTQFSETFSFYYNGPQGYILSVETVLDPIAGNIPTDLEKYKFLRSGEFTIAKNVIPPTRRSIELTIGLLDVVNTAPLNDRF